MLEERKQWIRRRFEDIDEETLGRIEEVNKMSWPDIEKEFEVNGNDLKFRMILFTAAWASGKKWES